jgi:hypothetical protein
MSTFETPSEFRAAFDALLAVTHRQLRIYDHDLGLLDLHDAARLAALRALCVAGRRVEVLLDDISHVARDHPRLMQLLRDFGHVLEIRQADPDAPRPDQAFVLADRQGVLLRADKMKVHGALHEDDTARATELNHSFEAMWQRAPAQVSASTLGL